MTASLKSTRHLVKSQHPVLLLTGFSYKTWHLCMHVILTPSLPAWLNGLIRGTVFVYLTSLSFIQHTLPVLEDILQPLWNVSPGTSGEICESSVTSQHYSDRC